MLKAVRPQAAVTDGLYVDKIGKSFGDRPVVKGVSLRLGRGEVAGLLGPNGAGKTTCFYMITGLIAADYGSIYLDGENITAQPMYQRARMGVGYLPQETSIFRGMSVEQNVMAVVELREKNRAKAKHAGPKKHSAIPATSGKGSNVSKKKKSGKKSSGSKAMAKRSGFAGRMSRGFLGVPGSVLPMIAGAAVGVISVNIFLPKIQARFAFAATPIGSTLAAAGIGVAGYFAIRKLHPGLALGFCAGAASVPVVGFGTAQLSKAGINGLRGLGQLNRGSGTLARINADGSTSYEQAPLVRTA